MKLFKHFLYPVTKMSNQFLNDFFKTLSTSVIALNFNFDNHVKNETNVHKIHICLGFMGNKNICLQEAKQKVFILPLFSLKIHFTLKPLPLKHCY